ncbi:sigma-54-dependent Fis family transcriptional regulator [Phragmitibacter flavus]|uniref:Sigma-54-dependent Fis family transcriptional regulator n=1 Tax=Phragmitibacter flavus TaxID=2576071 RepID=A0A5R8KB45_9BACT|nr:sigma-54 dependent transcriptional regulator [Phragmitibacter flavus]TLD69538.1 sigma-54-dependent Fis family transcriptional regulator [Phragmitibacter flavus]
MDILIVDDEKIIRDVTSQLIEDAGHYAESAANPEIAFETLKESNYDLVLLDMNLGAENGLDVLEKLQKQYPQVPVVVFTAAASVTTAVETMRRGAMDFLEKPFTHAQLSMVLARVQKHKLLAERVVELETQVAGQAPEYIFDSTSAPVQSAFGVLFRAAETPASVLILGESGTGKSVVAKAVHDRSRRLNKPFITVNCPSLSKELLESELFGHVRGAFTGAMKDHWGKVKAAEGGTLFLDEIGELPLEIQPKLLRLLQDREYERVGENVTRSGDVRIIAATNRDLSEAVANGTFREDLFYRLNVITVEMPPLRQRPGDLERFAEKYLLFFAKQCARKARSFSPEARACMLAHGWPGNLRELRNAIERAVILSQGKEIEASDLPNSVTGNQPVAMTGGAVVGDLISLEELETSHIRAVLSRTTSLHAAAEVLGIDQATLYRKRKKLGMAGDGEK